MRPSADITSAGRLWIFFNFIDSLIVQLSYITLKYSIVGLTSVLYIEHNENLGSLYLTLLSRFTLSEAYITHFVASELKDPI